MREETFHALPEAREQSKKDQSSFTYVGRALSHTAPITGIAFGNKDGVETLISVSDDQ